ncbi:tyrosine-type recombinase/integrase [Streptomyces sp. NPDC058175]|uniref:tyrosine-type recombinase/integrase n=1 Tax=Streptomyces sp. NPDC058175 TaxID=3346367 RepID=UPI0036E55DF7
MSGTEIERADVVDAELVPTPARASGGAEVAQYDPEVEAVLRAMREAAKQHLSSIRPEKTKKGYAQDWKMWEEFHAWLAERTGMVLPLVAVDEGTLVGFVQWLDDVKHAAPATIDRRITGVTVEARARGAHVPKDATVAARKALKPLKKDRARQARGRGQATPATPAHLRQVTAAGRTVPKKPGSRRRRATYELPELAVLRNHALALMEFAIAGRAAEAAALDVDDIVLTGEGLEVHVPSIKDREARDVEVGYADDSAVCPVLAWQAWKEAAGLTEGPAFRSVDQWGHLGTARLSADAVRLAVTRAAAQGGVNVKLTGHSLRSGFITASAKGGARPDVIRRQSGHAPNSPVFESYIRKGKRWEETAGKGVL